MVNRPAAVVEIPDHPAVLFGNWLDGSITELPAAISIDPPITPEDSADVVTVGQIYAAVVPGLCRIIPWRTVLAGTISVAVVVFSSTAVKDGDAVVDCTG
jgi:hypothetical protein